MATNALTECLCNPGACSGPPECHYECCEEEGRAALHQYTFVNGTPHSVTLQYPEGTLLTVPPLGRLINARPVEREVGGPPGVTLVETAFEPEPESLDLLEELERTDAAQDERQIVLGSIIAAQAYPGRVLAMVPVAGFERVPPAEKRMRADKLIVFPERSTHGVQR